MGQMKSSVFKIINALESYLKCAQKYSLLYVIMIKHYLLYLFKVSFLCSKHWTALTNILFFFILSQSYICNLSLPQTIMFSQFKYFNKMFYSYEIWHQYN